MKIAIIAPGFTGATLPLAQHLCKMGHHISCYYLVETGSQMIESLDFDDKISIMRLMISIPVDHKLFRYLDKKVSVKIIPSYRKRHTLSKILIGKIPAIINYLRIRRICRYIESQKYDIINLVHHNELTLQMINNFSKKKIPFCVSFHEVVENLISPKARVDIVNSLQGSKYIIVHSEKTRNDLMRYYKESIGDKSIYTVYFGPFESYWQYGKGSFVEQKKDYLLFLGSIRPYKGLKNLFDAMEVIKNLKINVIVAGRGFDPILGKMRNDPRFYIINRYIKNEELCYLVANCRAIVCPYETASQSGLVQTAFAFNKPVIATDVGAFAEVIDNNINGILVEPGKPEKLALAIMEVFEHKFSVDVPLKLNWDNIATEYLNIFKLASA